jgi:hypothetical protein
LVWLSLPQGRKGEGGGGENGQRGKDKQTGEQKELLTLASPPPTSHEPGGPLDTVLHHQYIDRINTHFYVEPPRVNRPKDSVIWSVSINPKKSAPNVTIRLDYTYFTGGHGVSWTPIQSLFVKRLDFIIGAAENIAIAELDASKDYNSWHWAFGRQSVIHLSMHRCCLMFLIGDDEVDRFDFVIYTWNDRNDTDKKRTDLILIGEDRFSFAKDWPAVSLA